MSIVINKLLIYEVFKWNDFYYIRSMVYLRGFN